jgi:hypothetical protein
MKYHLCNKRLSPTRDPNARLRLSARWPCRYDIIRMLSAATKAFQHTCVISLLQPPPEVFEVFDEVLIMRQVRLPLSDVSQLI